MPLLNFEKNDKGKLVAVFDIGSASVGGAVFLFVNRETPPVTLFSTRENLPFQTELDHERMFKATLRAVENIAHAILKSGLGRSVLFYVLLASHLHMIEARSVTTVFDESTLITKKMIDEMVENDMAKFVSETNLPGGKNKVMERVISQIKLNGYETSAPYGGRAQAVDVAYTIGIYPKYVENGISESILSVFNQAEIKFNSFSSSAFAVVRDVFSDDGNFIFLDIAGEVTEILISKGGSIHGNYSIPLGYNSLLRNLVRKRSQIPEEILSRLSSGDAKMADDFFASWHGGISDTLSLVGNKFLPRAIYFITREQVKKIFDERLRALRLEDGPYRGGKNFTIIPLSDKYLNSFFGGSGVASDTFLKIAILFVNKIADIRL